jgi:hypothetical protein
LHAIWSDKLGQGARESDQITCKALAAQCEPHWEPESGHVHRVAYSNLPDALRSYRVATMRAWNTAGISPRRFRSLVEAGELVRVRHGVYATAQAMTQSKASPSESHKLLAAAVLAVSSRRDYVVSHESAALIHGFNLLKPPRDDTVVLTCQPGDLAARARTNAGVKIHVARLPARHLVSVAGVRLTSRERTLADLARALPFMDAVVVVDDAIRRRLTAKSLLWRVLQECGNWPGTVSAREVIDFSNGRSESALESCGRVVFRAHGLPPPALQVEFFGDDGRVLARADFAWLEHKTVAEADGMLKYNDPANTRVMRAQFRRDRLLRELGYKVVHFTWDELFRQQERVISRVREAFAAPSPW